MQTFNVDYQVRAIPFPLHCMSQTREKWDSFVLSTVEVSFKWYECPMVFFVFIFIFCLETLQENNWIKNNFCRCYGNSFSKVPFQKYLKAVYVQSFFSKITRHLDNGIWRVLRTWVNMGVEPATTYLNVYCMLHFLWNNPSFKTEPSVDQIIFATIYLPF